MSEKRKRSADDRHGDHTDGKKKVKRGFVVGPENLPDGTYKRKTQKIKHALIERAQIKKNYAKLKRQGKIPDEPRPQPQSEPADVEDDEAQEPNTAPHPDRQTLIDKAGESPEEKREPIEEVKQWRRKPKSVPFKKEYERAQQRKAEAEEQRRAREEAERQRQQKIEERERFRKAMAKARTGGPNGQRKLGRESKVLLEKVKRMVGEGG